MAFPTVSTVLDNFNRADENPIAAPWNGGIAAAAATALVATNQLGQPTGANGDARIDGPFGPDVELQLEAAGGLTAGQILFLYARLQQAGAGTVDGYFLSVQRGATDTWALFKLTDNVQSQLGVSVTGVTNIGVGDKVGLEIIGTTITAYRFASAAWSSVLSRTDSTYTSAGGVGVKLSPSANEAMRYDNAIGGTVVGGLILPACGKSAVRHSGTVKMVMRPSPFSSGAGNF